MMQIDVIKVIGPKGQTHNLLSGHNHFAKWCQLLSYVAIALPIANKSNKFYSTQTMKAKETPSSQRCIAERVGLWSTFCMRGCYCLFNTTTILENGFFFAFNPAQPTGKDKKLALC